MTYDIHHHELLQLFIRDGVNRNSHCSRHLYLALFLVPVTVRDLMMDDEWIGGTGVVVRLACCSVSGSLTNIPRNGFDHAFNSQHYAAIHSIRFSPLVKFVGSSSNGVALLHVV